MDVAMARSCSSVRSARAQVPGSGHSGQTSAPDGLGPSRRAAGSAIGSMEICPGSRSLAATVISRSLVADSDPMTVCGGQGQEGFACSVDADQLLGPDGGEQLGAHGALAGG